MRFRSLIGLWATGSVLALAACATQQGKQTSASGSGSESTAAGTGGSTVSVGPGSGGGGGLVINPAGTGGAGGMGNCDNVLDVTYRDFDNATHPDFERGFAGDVPRRHLVESTLGADHTPTYKDNVGCPWLKTSPTDCDNWQASNTVIESAASFAQWYHDTDGINMRLDKTLTLTETSPGSGTFAYDSEAFFPLGPTEGWGITPKGNDLGQNFLFTTEIHMNFTYNKGQVFTFSGDDDLWIFVNGVLALDLGSMHAKATGTIDFDAQAAMLGIGPGGVYPMDVFHAERHTRESHFAIQTNIACFRPGPPPT